MTRVYRKYCLVSPIFHCLATDVGPAPDRCRSFALPEDNNRHKDFNTDITVLDGDADDHAVDLQNTGDSPGEAVSDSVAIAATEGKVEYPNNIYAI